MTNPFRSYKKLERHVFNMIIAEALLQLINAAFMLILLIYMSTEGYSREECAHFVKFRFFPVLLFALPLGIYLRKKRIKPLFYLSGIGAPLAGLLVIYAVEHKLDNLLYLSQFLWGFFFIFLQVGAIPYIMRNAKPETRTEAISLSYSTWSFGGIISGIIIFCYKYLFPESFDEKIILQVLSIVGLFSLWFIYKIDHKEIIVPPEKTTSKTSNLKDIAKAMTPNIIIAIGAGLTIPFIGLFFKEVHGLASYDFSIIGASALIAVFFSVLFVPKIKQLFGYKVAVPLTQSLAVMALIGLATTESYKYESYALALAVFFYVMRQPLMNLAGPMTTEITMNYVGKRNQEITSALHAAIWSGSWFLSGWAVEIFSQNGMSFMSIFLITAAFYAVGVVLYFLLILDYEKRQQKGLVE